MRSPGPVLTRVLAVTALMFLVPACWLIGRQLLGTHAVAVVQGCDYTSVGRSIDETCTARWTVHGHQVVGELEAPSGFEHPGQRVHVTVHGHTATSHSMGVPVVLLVLGLVFAVPFFPVSRDLLGRLEANRRRAASR